MESNIKKNKVLLLEDKRKTERLSIPVQFYFSLFPLPLDVSSPEWVKPFRVDDIGGNGLKFICINKIERSTVISLKIILPDNPKPILFSGETVWSQCISDRNCSTKLYANGVKFHKMDHEDRKRFVGYISDQILLHYIDSMGQVNF